MPIKNLKVGFYGVSVANDPPMRFEEILARFENQIPKDEARTIEQSTDEPVRLQSVTRGSEYWHGEMTKIRLHEELTKATTDGRKEKIRFDDNEGLGEDTAFLYHPETRTLVVHEARGGVPLSAFASITVL